MIEDVVDNPAKEEDEVNFNNIEYLGMMPCMFGSSIIPSMVWVFPLDVCPYAKIVPLYPDSTSGSFSSMNIAFKAKHIIDDLPLTMLLAVES